MFRILCSVFVLLSGGYIVLTDTGVTSIVSANSQTLEENDTELTSSGASPLGEIGSTRLQLLWISTRETFLSGWSTISESLRHLIRGKEAVQVWYTENNTRVWIIPSLMYVPILDFVLICASILLLGWYTLKKLS